MEFQTRLTHIHSEKEFHKVMKVNDYVLRKLPGCKGFMGLPLTVYYKSGEVVKATTCIQTQEQVDAILKENY